MLPCRRRAHNVFKCETLNSSRNLKSIMNCQQIHASSAIDLKIMFKYTQLIIVCTIIMRQYTHVLCIVVEVWRCPFFQRVFLKSPLPTWRITINCIFFAKVSSDATHQLLIVSYVLASRHDLVTWWWVHRTATNLKGSHTVRAADSDQTGRQGPTAADC